ncbi:MAG: hypothetical protein LQ337_005674 [Flavoplaca oasis]|nr:MAG: hypothetical protein LQ337_005674 [Flavoplaca oasis]
MPSSPTEISKPQQSSNAHEAQNKFARNYLDGILKSADEEKAKGTPSTSAPSCEKEPTGADDEASAEDSSVEDESKPLKEKEESDSKQRKHKGHRHRRHGSDSKKGGSHSSGGSHSKLVSVANKMNSFVDGKSVVDSGRGFRMRKGNS